MVPLSRACPSQPCVYTWPYVGYSNSFYNVGCQADMGLLGGAGMMVKLVFFLPFISNSWKLKPLTELSPLQIG